MDGNYEIIDLDEKELPDYSFKAVISGNSGVGKTSIIEYEINNKIKTESTSTIVLEHYYKNYRINDKIIRLQIWDTCGEENYGTLTKNFYRSALCIFVVFSLDDANSFANLDKWIYEIKEMNENESPMIVLIGNKSDKEAERKVSKEEIENYCKKMGIEYSFETSAKNGDSIHELFKEVMKKLYIKFVEQYNTDIYSTKTFNSSSQNSEAPACGFNSEKCKACGCFVF